MDLPLLRNAKDLKDKKILLRLGLNVPIKNDEIQNDFRIRKSLSTIQFLQEKGAQVIILSHHSDEKQSLEPVADFLSQTIPLNFIPDIYNADKLLEVEPPKVIFLENLRFWEGEKNNDIAFAKQLSSLGDIYVNDAFAASHREHASIVSLPKLLPSYAGILFEDEVKNLSLAFDPPHPFLLVLGGAKPATKIPVIEKFIEYADTIFIGGAVAHNFFKEQGYEIGKSLFEESSADIKTLLDSNKIHLPMDVVVKNTEGVFEKNLEDVLGEDTILDIGPRTIRHLRELVEKSRFLLWNGPLGEYDISGFEKGTIEFAKIIAESETRSIIGGGDTLAVISKLNIENKFDFLSTAGGAMLLFLATGTLPGIEALEN